MALLLSLESKNIADSLSCFNKLPYICTKFDDLRAEKYETLINSVYNDEVELIGKLCETENKREKEAERQKEVQVFGFMFR